MSRLSPLSACAHRRVTLRLPPRIARRRRSVSRNLGRRVICRCHKRSSSLKLLFISSLALGTRSELLTKLAVVQPVVTVIQPVVTGRRRPCGGSTIAPPSSFSTRKGERGGEGGGRRQGVTRPCRSFLRACVRALYLAGFRQRQRKTNVPMLAPWLSICFLQAYSPGSSASPSSPSYSPSSPSYSPSSPAYSPTSPSAKPEPGAIGYAPPALAPNVKPPAAASSSPSYSPSSPSYSPSSPVGHLATWLPITISLCRRTPQPVRPIAHPPHRTRRAHLHTHLTRILLCQRHYQT